MLIANLKSLYNNIRNNALVYFFSFLLMPLGLSIVMFKTQSSMMSGKIKITPISINIVDEDRSASSSLLVESFKQEDSKKYFILKEDGDFKLTIATGFEDLLLEENRLKLVVETEGNSPSIYDEEFLKTYLDSLGRSILNEVYKGKLIANMEDQEASLKLLEELNEIESGIDIGKENILKEEKIAFNEYNGITMIQYIFITFLMSAVLGNKKLKETTGLDLRIASLPVDPFKFQMSELVAGSINMFLFSALYIVVCRFIGMGFSKNLFENLLLSFIISFTTASLAQVLINIRVGIATLISYIILYSQLVLGGMIGPVNKLFENTIMEKFTGLNLNTIFINPFMDLGNEIFSIRSLLANLIVIFFSIVILYILLAYKNLRRARNEIAK